MWALINSDDCWSACFLHSLRSTAIIQCSELQWSYMNQQCCFLLAAITHNQALHKLNWMWIDFNVLCLLNCKLKYLVKILTIKKILSDCFYNHCGKWKTTLQVYFTADDTLSWVSLKLHVTQSHSSTLILL